MNRKEGVMTREEVNDEVIALWTHLARTGGGTEEKESWEGFDKYDWIDWEEASHCPLCAYRNQSLQEEDVSSQTSCKKYCPYAQHFGETCYGGDSVYNKWENAETKATRKKYAKLFLLQLLELNGDEPQEVEEEPKPEWEDITEDCKVEPRRHSVVGCVLADISYHGECVAMLGINGVEMSKALRDGEYALAEDTMPTAQGTIWFTILRRIK